MIAYRCAMQSAVASSAIRWLLYAGDGEELDWHPLLDLLRHPNSLQVGTAFLESVYAYLQIAGNAYIERGDILLFRYDRQPQHAALAIGPDRMIHSFAVASEVVETIIDDYWQRHLNGIYRFETAPQ